MAQLSGHLWSATILVASATVALAAERLSAPPRKSAGGALDAAAVGDVGHFMTPVGADSMLSRFRVNVRIDPLEARQGFAEQSDIASAGGIPTVPSSARSSNGRGLTAILIADERRVAVIDEATVSVGDVLGNGARVAAIQPDRVFVVEKNGRWRTLTLTKPGQ
jgi:hypothetical protein